MIPTWYLSFMKLITRNTDYAIRALVHIAGRKNEKVSAVALAKDSGIPGPFLRRILQRLSSKRFVKSYKGIGGGFTLAKTPSSIYISDVIEAFQGPLRLNECLFKKSVCPNRGSCLLKKKIDKIERHVVDEVGNVTLASLISPSAHA
jgi:Rrf2 family protein